MTDRPDTGRHTGEPGDDIDEDRVWPAAQELVIAAGRPAGWVIQSDYEREAWCEAVRRVIRAYEYWEGQGTARGHRGPVGQPGLPEKDLHEIIYKAVDEVELTYDYCYCDDVCTHGDGYLDRGQVVDAVVAALKENRITVRKPTTRNQCEHGGQPGACEYCEW